MNENWGKMIKSKRLKLRLSQKELADMIGVDRSTVTKYEYMKREPQFYILAKLAIALDLDLNELIIGEKNKKVSK